VRSLPCRRYNSETLAVRYKGHSISDVLNLPSSDALKLSRTFHKFSKTFDSRRVGLGYVTLGQSATTLSGVKPSASSGRELSKRQTGRTPTFSTNPPPACISTTCENSSNVLSAPRRSGHTGLSSSTTSTLLSKPTGSSTSAPKAAKAAAHRRQARPSSSPAQKILHRPGSRRVLGVTNNGSPQWQLEVIGARSVGALFLIIGMLFGLGDSGRLVPVEPFRSPTNDPELK